MNTRPIRANEAATEAFSRQAPVFDELYAADAMIQYKRDRVRKQALAHLPAGGSILELNAGTGEDALFFAEAGMTVHATDAAEGMLEELEAKTSRQRGQITVEKCSFTALNMLRQRGPYDMVFSNFGGLNCTPDVDQVIASLPALLKPGGVAVLVIISDFCLWELLLLFRGKVNTAFRRFFSRNGRMAQVEGVFFRCWYYSPRKVSKRAQRHFRVVDVQGLCSIVPPSYMEGFAEKYPRVFKRLARLEDRWCHRWPVNALGDYFVLTVERR